MFGLLHLYVCLFICLAVCLQLVCQILCTWVWKLTFHPRSRLWLNQGIIHSQIKLRSKHQKLLHKKSVSGFAFLSKLNPASFYCIINNPINLRECWSHSSIVCSSSFELYKPNQPHKQLISSIIRAMPV